MTTNWKTKAEEILAKFDGRHSVQFLKEHGVKPLAAALADAERKGAERVVKAVEETACNNVYHKEDAENLKVGGLCNFCSGFVTNARAALAAAGKGGE